MKYFNRHEFACNCGCGFDVVDFELAEVLDDVREHFGLPVRITSGCRCPSYNKQVGGEPGSEHMHGKAADIVIDGVPASAVCDYLAQKYPGKYGIGRYSTWTHIDSRTRAARWAK